MPTIFFTFWEKLKKPWWSILPRHFSQVGHYGPPPWGVMDHPYDFLGVQKLTSILLFEYQNVVLVRIFHGLAHFFFKKSPDAMSSLCQVTWFDLYYKKRRSGLEDSWVIFSNENYCITLEWISFDIKNIFMIVKFGGPLCPAWKRSLCPIWNFWLDTHFDANDVYIRELKVGWYLA